MKLEKNEAKSNTAFIRFFDLFLSGLKKIGLNFSSFENLRTNLLAKLNY